MRSWARSNPGAGLCTFRAKSSGFFLLHRSIYNVIAGRFKDVASLFCSSKGWALVRCCELSGESPISVVAEQLSGVAAGPRSLICPTAIVATWSKTLSAILGRSPPISAADIRVVGRVWTPMHAWLMIRFVDRKCGSMEQNFLFRLLNAFSSRFDHWRFLRALGQKPDQVVIRMPGERFLSAPEPIGPDAAEHWEFAWLADSAYGESRVKELPDAEKARSIESSATALARAGWRQWAEDVFLDDKLIEQFTKYHLRVQVWERASQPAVAVTFGGTVFRNEMDWRANLRWFFQPGGEDEYTLTQKEFAKAFAKYCAERNKLGRPIPASLYSTGHSLGGGLAQQFAYALPDLTGVPRVEKVYAFDPSPVTGFFSVEKRLRDINRAGLKIDRIYERGEVLAIARSLTSLFWKPSAKSPAIRGVRYNLFYTCNPVAGHSMKMLAGKLEAAAHGSQVSQGPIPTESVLR